MAFDPRNGRVLLFGGEDGLYDYQLADTWQWDGTTWTALRPRQSPPARCNHAMAWDPIGQRVLLFGGATETATMGDTWAWDGRDWTQLQPAHSPPPRWYHAMATDTVRGRVVLFGGAQNVGVPFWGTLADTWEWDGTDWIQRTPAISPPLSIGHGMAFHAASQRTVLFGGGSGWAISPNTTWLWDGSSWTPSSPTGSPTARHGPLLMEDPLQPGGVLMRGGHTENSQGIDEIWRWDGTRWLQVTQSAPTPGQVWADEAIGDPVRRQVVLHWGVQTWTWDGSQWRLAFDANRDHLVGGGNLVAGGRAGGPLVVKAGSTSVPAATWQIQGNRIVNLRPPTTIPGLFSYLLGSAYHQAAGVVIALTANSAWSWDGTTWAQTASPGVFSSSIAYDSARRKVVLFGGSETWEWDPQGWVRVLTTQAPPPRSESPMAYDPLRGRCVLFGGLATHGLMQDLWEWDGSVWTQRTPANMPAARHGHVLVPFPALGGVVLMGGQVQDSCALWLWDGTSWTRLPADQPPCLPYQSRTVGLFDPEFQRLMLVLRYDPWSLASPFWELRAQTLRSSLLDPRPGEQVTLGIQSPTTPNTPFVLALSGGAWPGIPYRDDHGLGSEVIPLNNDRILRVSLGFGWWGVTNGSGVASLAFTLPNDPSLLWSEFHAAGILFGTAAPGVRAVTNNVHLRVVP